MNNESCIRATCPWGSTDDPRVSLGHERVITVTYKNVETGEVAAEGIVNYTTIDGEKVPFLHHLHPLQGSVEKRGEVLTWILTYLRYQGEKTLYAYNIRGKIEPGFLERHGFTVVDGGTLAYIKLAS